MDVRRNVNPPRWFFLPLVLTPTVARSRSDKLPVGQDLSQAVRSAREASVTGLGAWDRRYRRRDGRLVDGYRVQ